MLIRLKKNKKLSHGLLFSIVFLSLGLIGIIFLKPKEGKKLEIKAAIIPHHLVAEELMTDLGSRLAKNTLVSRVVIVGPNHDEVGRGHFLTDDVALGGDGKLLTVDESLVNKDHACYAPKSILKKYLSETVFSCLLVSSRARSEEIGELVSKIRGGLGEDGVLVASVDFSHYLPMNVANQNDLLTWKDIEKYDVVALNKKGNNFLDSPKTLEILFSYLKVEEIVNMEQIKHVNSAQILNIPDIPSTTSYFEVIYW